MFVFDFALRFIGYANTFGTGFLIFAVSLKHPINRSLRLPLLQVLTLSPSHCTSRFGLIATRASLSVVAVRLRRNRP